MAREIPVYLVGSGNAARAMCCALEWVKDAQTGLVLEPVRKLDRGQALPAVNGPSLLLIANPHALHAPLIREADSRGFTHIVCEKPVVVDGSQIEMLRDTRAFVAVCHGYRQNWGPQRMRAAIEQGQLGKLIAIEGRYWQSSSAAHAVAKLGQRDTWKNDTALAGHCDTLMDLGTHWADLVGFLAGTRHESVRGWLSYLNAEAPHRDTHLHLQMDFPGGLRTFGSVSKTVHGAGNHLEVVVIGTQGLMKWNFERPDELVHASGKQSHTFSRSSEEPVASKQPPHHALGWLEGYASIFESVLKRLAGKPAASVPTLDESLAVAQALLALIQK
jgi:predicted dehydrogenase